MDVESLWKETVPESQPTNTEKEQKKQDKIASVPVIQEDPTPDADDADDATAEEVDEAIAGTEDSVRETPVDQENDISPTRRVQFKEDLVRIHLYYPDELPASPKNAKNGSPDECQAQIKPILKRRRKRGIAPPPSGFQIRSPEDSMQSKNPLYGGVMPLSYDNSSHEQERYLLKSLLDLDCSMQMMKNKSDVLYARVQRAIQRLHKS